MARKEKVKDPNHLSFGRLMAFKSSDISAAWVNVIVLNRLSFYASTALGVDVGTVGVLLMASKIVDAFTDIFAGWLVDNTHTKWGKGRPYELSIIGMTLCTILLFSASPEWETAAKCAWIFCMYTFVFSIFSTLRGAAANAYTIRHFSNNPILLRKVASYGGIITMFGSMILTVAFPILMNRVAINGAGWGAAVAMVMIPATLIGLLRFFLCKEDPNVADDTEKGEKTNLKEIFTLFRRNKYVWYYAIIMLAYNISVNLAVGDYYFNYIVGDLEKQSLVGMFSVIVLPLMLVFPAIMKKIGSMGKMITYFCGLGVLGYIIVFFSGANIVGVYVGMILGTLATLPVAYYGVLFIMNICNYNEMLGMKRMEGSSGILSNFASKTGAALGAYVTGLMLSIGGFVSTTDLNAVTQPDSALMMIRVDFAIVPIICLVIIAVCALAFSRLEPKVEAYEAEKKAKLEAAQSEATEA